MVMVKVRGRLSDLADSARTRIEAERYEVMT